MYEVMLTLKNTVEAMAVCYAEKGEVELCKFYKNAAIGYEEKLLDMKLSDCL